MQSPQLAFSYRHMIHMTQRLRLYLWSQALSAVLCTSSTGSVPVICVANGQSKCCLGIQARRIAQGILRQNALFTRPQPQEPASSFSLQCPLLFFRFQPKFHDDLRWKPPRQTAWRSLETVQTRPRASGRVWIHVYTLFNIQKKR